MNKERKVLFFNDSRKPGAVRERTPGVRLRAGAPLVLRGVKRARSTGVKLLICTGFVPKA